MIFDYLIIGGGIVGCAVAMQLQKKRPSASVLVLEKHEALAAQQTGHNSGVIHSGIYYAPGSLKADFCVRGNAATVAFCKEHSIAYQITGKLLVATSKAELQRMHALHQRSQALGIPSSLVSSAELAELEPYISGIGAIRVASTGITDYTAITRKLAELVTQGGGQVKLSVAVTAIREESDVVTVSTTEGDLRCRQLVCCAGMQADRLASMAGIPTDFAMVPFRGEYFRLPPKHQQIIQHLIYPIPDPELPFLGVHLTRMIDGSVTVGPNAVLGFSREGYPKGSVNWRDCRDMMGFPGFWPLMRKNLMTGLGEMKNSLYKPGYLALCQKYCPMLEMDDLMPMSCGIRAQAVMRNGQLVQDFLIKSTERTLHVCNAPSPAATSALPIGEYIAHQILKTASHTH